MPALERQKVQGRLWLHCQPGLYETLYQKASNKSDKDLGKGWTQSPGTLGKEVQLTETAIVCHVQSPAWIPCSAPKCKSKTKFPNIPEQREPDRALGSEEPHLQNQAE